MALPITPPTQADSNVDTNVSPDVVPLFVSQAPRYNQTAGGTTLNFGTPEPNATVSAGEFRTAQGTTTLFDPGTGVAEGSTSFFGDARPFQPIGVPVEPGAGATDDSGQFGTTSFFGGPSVFQPIGIPLEGEQPLLGTTTNFENQTFPTSGFNPTQSTQPAPAQFSISPQPNVLDRYSSYTYQAAVYLLPERFGGAEGNLNQLNSRQKFTPNSYNLLFQSGGAPINAGGVQAGGAAAVNTGADDAIVGGTGKSQSGRNPFFSNDFYIDNIVIENSLFGKSTRAAHSAVTLKFTVTEPNGISLLDCMYEAVKNAFFQNSTGPVNYTAAEFLMVIRFYGYDENGQIVSAAPAGIDGAPGNSAAVVEKQIPFRIKQINWSIANRLVTYEFDCVPVGQLRGSYTPFGTVPSDVQLIGSTVEEMLAGDTGAAAVESTAGDPGASTTPARNNRAVNGSISGAPAPAPASAAPRPSDVPRSSLVQALNNWSRLYKKVPDEYRIVFANGAERIAAALVTKPGRKVDKKATPMSLAPTQDPSQSSPDKQGQDITSRNFGVTAGQSIVQVIDQVISNSAYITDQAETVRTETTGQEEPNAKTVTTGMRWYNIVMTADPLEYDDTRNDYAYRITYTIVPYQLTDFQSSYFPLGQFQGVHKRYPYWFTGENTAVLDYQAKFDKLYTLTVSGITPDDSLLARTRKEATSSMRDIAVLAPQARSSESEAGAAGGANELAANAKEYLYNPGDNANAKIRIIGDPAWIQQGSLTGRYNAANASYEPFEPDGTINFDVRDVMFEIAWQRPEDYNLENGLADPYARTARTFGNRDPIQSVIYRARKVTSTLNRGRFEQEIEGTLYRYPIPKGTNRAAMPAAAGTNTAINGSISGRVRETVAATGIGTDPALRGQVGSTAATAAVPGVLGDAARAAIAQQQARGQTNTLITDPGLPSFTPGLESGQFSFTATRPSDTVQPSPPARPVTSNGVVVGPAVSPLSPTNLPTSALATARRLADNPDLLANLQIDPAAGSTVPVRTTPQLISRES